MLLKTPTQCCSYYQDEGVFNHKVYRSADDRHMTCANWFCGLEVTLFDLHEHNESIVDLSEYIGSFSWPEANMGRDMVTELVEAQNVKFFNFLLCGGRLRSAVALLVILQYLL